MVKEIKIIKTLKIDSSEVAKILFDSFIEVIDDKVRDYLEQYCDLTDRDIDDILSDDEWWNSFLEDFINEMKCEVSS